MLTEIFYALCDHLRTLGLPVFLADCVPQVASLPYITANVQPPLQPSAEGSLILTGWCTGEKSNAQRLALADKLVTVIPHRGLWLPTDAGCLVITHDGGIQCVTQRDAQGVILHFKLKLFPNE